LDDESWTSDVPSTLISAANHPAFQRSLLRWYRQHGRDLPWRQTRDPYAILVSEFMLQQTQVATVRPYYSKWLKRFPDFATLAGASENDVLQVWQGLGYYARARNLHAAAKTVVDRYRGRFPRKIERMRQLPGVGKYTAHAVASFAFDQSVPIVEANTARVLSRLFNFQKPIDQTYGREVLWNHAGSLIRKNSARIYNSALIDLGALVCLPRQPKCSICPVRKFCRATNPEILPIKKVRPKTKRLIENHAFVLSENKILLQLASQRWRGMWILPSIKSKSTRRRPIHMSIFPFTHHRVMLRVFRQRPRKIDDHSERWFPIRRIDSIPIPGPHRRAISSALKVGR
jgi:A/G-specific adenine glycosylase